jgi:hypothetical protein
VRETANSTNAPASEITCRHLFLVEMGLSGEKEGATMGSRADLADIAHSPQLMARGADEKRYRIRASDYQKKAALKLGNYTMLLDKNRVNTIVSGVEEFYSPDPPKP